MLEHSMQKVPAEPGLLYLQNYLEFFDALIAGERGSFGLYLEASGQRINVLLEGMKKDPLSVSYLSSIHLQSSLLCAYHAENFRAAKHYYYAYRYLRQAEEADPGNPLNYRNRGLITLVSSSMPEEYRWLLKIIGLRGELEEGFGYLKEYYSASEGAGRLEACLLLIFAGRTLDPGKRNLSDPCDTPGTGENPPGNIYGQTLLRYARALDDLASGNSREVVRNLGDYRQGDGERAFPYVDLLLGEALLNGLDSAAQVPLERFIRDNTGIHYRHYALHRLGWCHALKGEWGLYREAEREVLHSGEPYLDSDRQSLAEALDTLPLNTALLKARLLFDGGFYREALGELGKSPDGGMLEEEPGIPLLSSRDTIEYRYRLARTWEKLEDPDKAMAYYEQVIAYGPGEAWYFVPNATLQLGILHERAGNVDQAMGHYRTCLKINNSAYKKSIDYKARQGIRRLESL